MRRAIMIIMFILIAVPVIWTDISFLVTAKNYVTTDMLGEWWGYNIILTFLFPSSVFLIANFLLVTL